MLIPLETCAFSFCCCHIYKIIKWAPLPYSRRMYRKCFKDLTVGHTAIDRISLHYPFFLFHISLETSVRRSRKLGFYILEWNLWCGSTFKSSKDTRTTPCQFLRVLHQKNKTWRIMNGFSPCEWVHSFSFMIETVATVITSSINN